jgi:hypothetical protein
MACGRVVRMAMALLLGVVAAPPLAGQRTTVEFDPDAAWTWEQVRAMPGVDTAQVAWLERAMARDEAVALFRLVAAMSPSNAQLLAARFVQDPSFHYRRTASALLDSTAAVLSRRPPAGVAGMVHVAYHAERLRRAAIEWMGGAARFTPGPLALEPRTPSDRLTVRLDMSVARLLLDMIAGAVPVSVARLSDEPVLHALVSHRGQRFYAMAATLEVMAANLTVAASNRPVDTLYRYAFPIGLMHYADVRNRLDAYRALVDTLSGRAADIAGHVSGVIGPYVPEDVRVDRTVHVLFADGADGWAADGIAAIDLEYFGDDYETLLRLLVHETMHAVQHAVPQPAAGTAGSAADSLFRAVLGTVLMEGTATHVAPPRAVSDREYDELVDAGVALLEELHGALYGADRPDLTLAAELHTRGVRRSGPLYWVGAEIARRIEARDGPAAVAETLRRDGAQFLAAYARDHDVQGPRLLSDAVIETVHRLMSAPPAGGS